MSQSLMSIEVDLTDLFRAMDRASENIERRLKTVASATADRVVTGARSRVRRATGVTALGIHKEETHDKTGYVVLAWDPQLARRLSESGNNAAVINRGKPGWIEHGTVHMEARPFFFQSARLEEGTYERQARQAIDDGIADAGLG